MFSLNTSRVKMASEKELNSLEFLIDKACAAMDSRESSELKKMLYGTHAE